MKLIDHPQDLHDARNRMTHKTNNDADTPAANNDRRTPDDEWGGEEGGVRNLVNLNVTLNFAAGFRSKQCVCLETCVGLTLST